MYVGRFYFQVPLKVVKFWKTIFFTQASFLTRIAPRLIRCCSHMVAGKWGGGVWKLLELAEIICKQPLHQIHQNKKILCSGLIENRKTNFLLLLG